MNKDQMSILVLSFDGYSDIWEAFFVTKNKYWKDCRYNTRLVSNTKTYPGVETICVGKEVCWGDRTLKALELIEEPYVMLLLEDYLFASPVNETKVDNAVKFAIENDINYMRIVTIPKSRYVTKADGQYVPIYENEEYGINLQASIWKTSFLKEAVRKYYGSPWDFEIGFLAETIGSQKSRMTGCFATRDNLIVLKNGVLKGKWFPSVLRYFSKNGLAFAWEYRGKLSIYDELKYNVKVGVKKVMGYRSRRILKRILTVLGMKFVSKY